MNAHRLVPRIFAPLLLVALSQSVTAPTFALGARELALEVEIDSASDAALVRRAIDHELGEVVGQANDHGGPARGSLKVHLERATKTLTVTFADLQGGVVSRSIAAPDDVNELASASALLASNLVRDQTSEVLAQLKPVEKSAPLPAAADSKPSKNQGLPARPLFPANLAFFYPLATNMGKPDIHTYFDLGALYTRVGSVDGLQLSGVVAEADGPIHGLQAGGAASFASGLDGLQVSGLLGVARQDIRGAQLAGLANIAGGRVSGAQSAVVNVAQDVDGAQVGIVNVARNVRGLQLGIVNVSDDVEGAAIGVASISKTGHVSLQAFGSGIDAGSVDLAAKFSTKYLHTSVGGVYHRSDGQDFVGYSFGIGTQIPVSDRFFAEFDLIASDLWRLHPHDEPAHKTRKYQFRPRLVAGYRFSPLIAVLAGGGTSIAFQKDFEGDPEIKPNLALGLELTP